MMGVKRLLRRAGRAARRAWPSRGAIVLLYHRIADAAVDPWALTVSPAHFEEHLDIVSRSFHPMRARELAAALDAGRGLDGGVLVTFDDGYADLLEQVRPRLDRFAVPATAFVVSGALDADVEFWWDALHRVLLETRVLPPVLDLPFEGAQRRWCLGSDGDHAAWRAWEPPRHSRQTVYREVYAALVSARPATRDEVVARLFDWAGVDRSARASHRALRTSELRRVAEDGLVEIGAHTVTHPSLPRLSRHEQWHEVAGSRAALRDVVGHDIDSFAYPFGTRDHLSRRSAALVRDAGFSTAFVNLSGVATSAADRFALPRFFVEDCDGEQLARTLADATGLRITA